MITKQNGLWVLNNSLDSDYSTQTNNVIAPSISCFPTAMVNTAYAVGIPASAFPTDNQYKQCEDAYNNYLTSEEIMSWAKSVPSIREALASGTEAREIWDLEAYAFNKLMQKKYPKVGNIATINWNLTIEKMIDTLFVGGGIVTSGNFCGFRHVVSVIGYVSKAKDDVLHNLAKAEYVTDIIIDDSYGDPRTKYKPVGKNGNNVVLNINEFWEMIKRSDGKRYGIIFKKIKDTDGNQNYIPRDDKVVTSKSSNPDDTPIEAIPLSISPAISFNK